MNQDSPFGSLQGSFGQSIPPGGVDYTHAQEDSIRQILDNALGASATGQALLQYAGQQQIEIRVIKGKESSGFIPEARAVYLCLAPELSTPSPLAVLEYGAFLRQAQLHFSGHKNPDLSTGSDETLKAFDIKIIDSLGVMCKIASELKDSGYTEYVDALVSTGHSELYEAYCNSGVGDAFIEAYFKAVKAK